MSLCWNVGVFLSVFFFKGIWNLSCFLTIVWWEGESRLYRFTVSAGWRWSSSSGQSRRPTTTDKDDGQVLHHRVMCPSRPKDDIYIYTHVCTICRCVCDDGQSHFPFGKTTQKHAWAALTSMLDTGKMAWAPEHAPGRTKLKASQSQKTLWDHSESENLLSLQNFPKPENIM